jgi:hypothetical protein
MPRGNHEKFRAERGRCPVCGKDDVRVRLSGILASHSPGRATNSVNWDNFGNYKTCRGVGLQALPAQEVAHAAER